MSSSSINHLSAIYPSALLPVTYHLSVANLKPPDSALTCICNRGPSSWSAIRKGPSGDARLWGELREKEACQAGPQVRGQRSWPSGRPGTWGGPWLPSGACAVRLWRHQLPSRGAGVVSGIALGGGGRRRVALRARRSSGAPGHVAREGCHLPAWGQPRACGRLTVTLCARLQSLTAHGRRRWARLRRAGGSASHARPGAGNLLLGRLSYLP